MLLLADANIEAKAPWICWFLAWCQKTSAASLDLTLHRRDVIGPLIAVANYGGSIIE